MIKPVVLVGTLNGHNIPYILDDTDKLPVTVGICTDLADLRIGYILAGLAVMDIVLEFDHGIPETYHVFLVLLQEVQNQPEGGLVPYAGERSKFTNCLLQ